MHEKNDWICGALCRGRHDYHAFSGESFSGAFTDCAAFADRVQLFLLLVKGYEDYDGEFGRNSENCG